MTPRPTPDPDPPTEHDPSSPTGESRESGWSDLDRGWAADREADRAERFSHGESL